MFFSLLNKKRFESLEWIYWLKLIRMHTKCFHGHLKSIWFNDDCKKWLSFLIPNSIFTIDKSWQSSVCLWSIGLEKYKRKELCSPFNFFLSVETDVHSLKFSLYIGFHDDDETDRPKHLLHSAEFWKLDYGPHPPSLTIHK